MYRHFLKVLFLIIIPVFFLGACFHASKQISLIDVYKNDGSLQCDQGFDKPASISAMQMELINAGIDVINSRCGVDGLMRPAVCGADTGNINIYRIHVTNVVDAEAFGFGRLSSLADHLIVDCPDS